MTRRGARDLTRQELHGAEPGQWYDKNFPEHPQTDKSLGYLVAGGWPSMNRRWTWCWCCFAGPSELQEELRGHHLGEEEPLCLLRGWGPGRRLHPEVGHVVLDDVIYRGPFPNGRAVLNDAKTCRTERGPVLPQGSSASPLK